MAESCLGWHVAGLPLGTARGSKRARDISDVLSIHAISSDLSVALIVFESLSRTTATSQ
jgi:hypothetical protein